MKTIWKFWFAVNDRVEISMPAGADILTVQLQAGVPCLWAYVDPDEESETIQLLIYGTGHPIDDKFNLRYLGTLQMGALVWHVFKER